MRSKSDVENRYLLKYAGYPDVQASSLRMIDNFALGPEYSKSRLRIAKSLTFHKMTFIRPHTLPVYPSRTFVALFRDN
jgi:hypothetical protein